MTRDLCLLITILMIAAVVPIASAATMSDEDQVRVETKFAGQEEMTKEDIIKDIEDGIDTDDEAISSVPGLKSNKGEDGKIYYTYRLGKSDVRINELDRDKLIEISQKISTYNQNVIMEQINSTREIMRQRDASSSPHSLPARPPSRLPSPPQKPPSLPPKR